MTADAEAPIGPWPILCAGLFAVPLLFFPHGGNDLVAKRLGVALLAAVLAFRWIRRPSLPRHFLFLPALLYVLISAASAAWAHNPSASTIETAAVLAPFLLFLASSGVNARGFQNATVGLAAAGLVVAIIGIAQYHALAFTWLPSVGLPSSTFGFRNVTASFLVVALPLVGLTALVDTHRGRRLLGTAALTGMLILLIYTRTRGAWLACAAAFCTIGCLLVWSKTLRRHIQHAVRVYLSSDKILIIVFLFILVAGIVLPGRSTTGVIQQFDEQKTSAFGALQSIFDATNARGRLDFWRNTVSMIVDHPVLGVGLDNWELIYPEYDLGQTITHAAEPVRPHNDLLWVAADLGLLGLFAYGWLLSAAARAGARAARGTRPEEALVALAALATLTAFVVHGLFSFPKEQPTTALLFWFALTGIGARSTDAAPQQTGRIPGALALAVVVLIVMLSWRHVRFEAAFSASVAATKSEMWPAAELASQVALEAGSFDHRASYLFAQALHKQDRTDEAEAAYRAALALHPNYANTHHNLAALYASRNDWTRSIRHYERALTLVPDYDQARINFGNTLIRAGRVEAARSQFERLVERPESAAQAHAALGAIGLYQNDLQTAVTHLESAVSVAPRLVEALNNLAIAYERSGRVRDAISTYERLIVAWDGDATYRAELEKHLVALRRKPLDP